MKIFADYVLLATALALPIVLFLLFRPRSRAGLLTSATLAIAAGWAFNVAYVIATQTINADHPADDNGAALSMVFTFGWACPLVLVLVTWVIRRFALNRT